MPKSAAVVAVMAVACAACTYDVPDLATDANDGGANQLDSDPGLGDGSLPEDGHGNGHPGMSDAEDTSNGVDAACTGVLCPCNNTSDCSSTAPICAQSITVGGPVYAAANNTNFCTAPCCTSSDCPAGSVCFASGVGGQYCVDPAWLNRKATAATARGGATCGQDTDCRSGRCAAGSCADTCCSLASSSSECASGASCTFGTFPGATNADMHFAPRCGPPGGSSTYGNPCTSNAQCKGGLCEMSGGGNCTNPCRTSAECGSGNNCDWDQQGNDFYWACFPWPNGTDGEGASCTLDTDCLGDYCGNSQCTNACFTNADCSVQGWTCTPQPQTISGSGNYVFLTCTP